ncbi:MAG: CDP-alcohol phosphatidyltransferase family protein [Legionella sp.]|jgi:phosphatidylcholine synthase
MNEIKQPYTLSNYIKAWSVHLLTASGAFIGVYSMVKIYQHEYVFALWLMAITVVIDAVDGTLARMYHVKSVLPNLDGALLDNIIDYLNYVITPCFFLLVKPGMLPEQFGLVIVIAISICSAYQFCQSDAKTPDHFFKGFPCYWNITVFYMFILNTSSITNALVLSFFCILIFVPIKYVYPSRLDYLTDSKAMKILMHICSSIYGISTLFLLLNYPEQSNFWMCLSLGYVAIYLLMSFYRTIYPLGGVHH